MGRQTSTPITERKTRVDGSVSDYTCERLVVVPPSRAVLRYVIERATDVGETGIHLAPGTVTVAHYWADRPYNVYHWLENGRTIAYYCNAAADTVIREDLVAYTDLVVDVLVLPSGAASVLDEDDVPADLAPAYRGAIARALDSLMSHPKRLAAEIESETRAALGQG